MISGRGSGLAWVFSKPLGGSISFDDSVTAVRCGWAIGCRLVDVVVVVRKVLVV